MAAINVKYREIRSSHWAACCARIARLKKRSHWPSNNAIYLGCCFIYIYIYKRVEGGESEIAARFMHDFGEEGKNFAIGLPSNWSTFSRCGVNRRILVRAWFYIYIYIYWIIDGSIMRNNVHSCAKNFLLYGRIIITKLFAITIITLDTEIISLYAIIYTKI